MHTEEASGLDTQVKALLSSDPELAHARASEVQDGGSKSTALLIASQYSRTPAMINALLDGGCDIDARDLSNGTALMSAVIDGDVEIARLLLGRGASANHKLDYPGTRLHGATAYDMARDKKIPAMVELLTPGKWDEVRVGPGHVLGSA
jgi:hypothetical protein